MTAKGFIPLRPKNTLAGLREALDTSPVEPARLSWSDYSALDPEEKSAYDEARLDWLASGLRVRTPENDLALKRLRIIMDTNRRVSNGRRGLIITAPPFFGKTELALSLARAVENTHAKQRPAYREMGDVPVVWVEVQSNATGKALLWSLVAFFGGSITPKETWSTQRLMATAIDLLQLHNTRLVVIDEAHCMAGKRYGTAGDPTDFIKLLQNGSSATFILCGVDLLSPEVFGTSRGLQVTQRCDVVRLAQLTVTNKQSASTWSQMLNGFDRILPLCDHRPGLLKANSKVLNEATGGCLGSLALVIHRLVAQVIADEGRVNEQVTPARLRDVLADVALTAATENAAPLHKIKAAPQRERTHAA